ncbi:putative PDGF/VEGF domain-containing protein 3 [Homarus americanus]|uniref:Putative PDGF/VEGF domain-containing protein 3 n=1 Tax=Homarus americanus TaxID=6706 RepID=A0A8J5N9L7_HOMAM|nr:putative PDGF/VEGF domain-containing protein 3 [Homarus americanus]
MRVKRSSSSMVVLLLVLAASLATIVPDFEVKDHTLAEKSIKRQVKHLQEMGCQPIRQKFYVKDMLGPESKLHDYQLYPNVFSVKRCVNSFSYCGDTLGEETSSCLPVNGTVKKKQFKVYYSKDDKKQYSRMKLDIHRKCECHPQFPSHHKA